MLIELVTEQGLPAGSIEVIVQADDVVVREGGCELAVMARTAFDDWLERPAGTFRSGALQWTLIDGRLRVRAHQGSARTLPRDCPHRLRRLVTRRPILVACLFRQPGTPRESIELLRDFVGDQAARHGYEVDSVFVVQEFSPPFTERDLIAHVRACGASIVVLNAPCGAVRAALAAKPVVRVLSLEELAQLAAPRQPAGKLSASTQR